MLPKIKETGRRLLQGKSKGTVPWMLSHWTVTGKLGETLAETLNTWYLLQKLSRSTVVKPLIPFIQSTAQRKIIWMIHLLPCCKPAAPKEKAQGERALSNSFYCTTQGIKHRREMPKAGKVFAGVRASPLQEPRWHRFIWGRGTAHTGNDKLLRKLFTERAWINWIIIQAETRAVMRE